MALGLQRVAQPDDEGLQRLPRTGRWVVAPQGVDEVTGRDEPSGGMVPTERFDRWRLDESSARLRVLLSAWWRMERS